MMVMFTALYVLNLQTHQDVAITYIQLFRMSKIKVHVIQKIDCWLPEAGRKTMGIYCLMGKEFQFYKMKKGLEMMVVMIVQQ